jgi:hypothetical protein
MISTCSVRRTSRSHVTAEAPCAFIAVDVGLDYRVVQRDGLPAIEFTFDGIDEDDRVGGHGWAEVTGHELHGRIFFHQGDDSALTACRTAPVTRQRRT